MKLSELQKAILFNALDIELENQLCAGHNVNVGNLWKAAVAAIDAETTPSRAAHVVEEASGAEGVETRS